MVITNCETMSFSSGNVAKQAIDATALCSFSYVYEEGDVLERGRRWTGECMPVAESS